MNLDLEDQYRKIYFKRASTDKDILNDIFGSWVFEKEQKSVLNKVSKRGTYKTFLFRKKDDPNFYKKVTYNKYRLYMTQYYANQNLNTDSDENEKPFFSIVYHDNGRIATERWTDSKSELHKEDGPAFIQYFENGNKLREVWDNHGYAHREDGPAVTEYHPDGTVRKLEWFIKNLRHREDGPAVIIYNKDGSVYSKTWYKNNRWIKEESPEIYD